MSVIRRSMPSGPSTAVAEAKSRYVRGHGDEARLERELEDALQPDRDGAPVFEGQEVVR